MHGLLGATIYTRKDVQLYGGGALYRRKDVELYRGTLYTIRVTMCMEASLYTMKDVNMYRGDDKYNN